MSMTQKRGLLIVACIFAIAILTTYSYKRYNSERIKHKEQIFIFKDFNNLECKESPKHSGQKWVCTYNIRYIPNHKQLAMIDNHYKKKGYIKFTKVKYENEEMNKYFKNEYDCWKPIAIGKGEKKFVKKHYKYGGFSTSIAHTKLIVYKLAYNNEYESATDMVKIVCLIDKNNAKDSKAACMVMQSELYYMQPRVLYFFMRTEKTPR